jgi:hypothetical protein
MEIEKLVELELVTVRHEIVSDENGVRQSKRYYLSTRGKNTVAVQVFFNPVTGEPLTGEFAPLPKKEKKARAKK